MRELKFRAFYQKKLYMQEYCGGFSYFIHNDSDALTLEDIFVAAERQKCIIQQYTGVKDKNGKEIYEGDIVSFQYRDEGLFNGVIGLDDMYLGYSVQDSKAFFGSMQITYDNTEELNVIGNIFENPELLK
jgi:uncharacterized phage protein (TIGR01671 family)